MAQPKNISGQVYGRLTAIVKIGKDKFGIAHWKCECECGKNINVRLGSLTSGATRSCGCLNQESRHIRMLKNTYAKTDGLSKHYLYQTWATMKQRCYNPNHAKFYLYGQRGITVCERWRDSFHDFIEDMGDRPEGRTLDRKNNDAGYSKENCEWQTHSIQNSNRRKYKRTSCRITYKKEIYGNSHN